MNICYGVEAHLNALRPVHSPLMVHMAVAICMWDLSSLMSELVSLLLWNPLLEAVQFWLFLCVC